MDRGNVFMGLMVALIIFFGVLLFVAVIADHRMVSGQWSIATNQSNMGYSNVHIGDDGSVFVLDGYNLRGIDPEGRQKWQIEVPAIETSASGDSYLMMESAAVQGGNLYVFLRSNNHTANGEKGELLAISPEGNVFWSAMYEESKKTRIVAVADTVYLIRNIDFGGASVTHSFAAMNLNGSTRWTHDRTYLEPVFDDAGTVYLIHGKRIPIYSDTLQAYAPNGTLLWERNLTPLGINAPVRLIINNQTLYLVTYYGVACIGRDGTVQWKRDILSYSVPTISFDLENNVYIPIGNNIEIYSPQGVLLANFNVETGPNSRLSGTTIDGIMYAVTGYGQPDDSRIEELPGFSITAYDLKSGEQQWSYTLDTPRSRIAVISRDNGFALIPWFYNIADSGNMSPEQLFDYYHVTPGTTEIRYDHNVGIYPAREGVYVSFWTERYEFPIVYGQSRCAYAGSLYAFDRTGKLLWEKQTDSYVDRVTEKNGTIYYSTGDGKLSAATVGLTAGLLAATFYLILRFAVVGAVARARSRLEKNENRNQVMVYISQNPGSRLYDIAKGLDMNVGTLRYHLLILSINHRVKADGVEARTIRYYANGRQFTHEEKLVIAFMKRNQIEKLLKTLVAQPGVPNTVLSWETGLPESAVSRYMRELADHGIVVKKRTNNGRLSYFIDDRYRNAITSYSQES